MEVSGTEQTGSRVMPKDHLSKAYRNQIGEVGAGALATSLSQAACALRELRIGAKDIVAAGVTAFCDAVTLNTKLIGQYK